MARFERSITINSPVEKVFDFLAVPTSMVEIMPSILEVKDIEPLPGGGHNFRTVVQVAGMRFEGVVETVEFVANERFVGEAKGNIGGTTTFAFQPTDGGTTVTFTADYTVPVPVLGKLAEGVVVKQMAREAELMLENLKDRMEG